MSNSTKVVELNDILVQSGLAGFTRNIKLGKFERSYEVAKRTLVILNNMVKDNHWPTARHLIDTLKGVCGYIDSLGLVETAVGNMTRRVMRIIRDECHNFNSQQSAQLGEETFDNFYRHEMNDTSLDLEMNKSGVKENILEGIEQELMNELELSSISIAKQATDYVQSDEIILTLGKSKVIESFLKNAANGSKTTGKRKFNVIVVELAPFFSGHEMAKNLNKSGISTLIIPDSAVFAIMSRVNKVIIGTHSMMANGGIKAPAGSHSIALAAKHFSVPLIVCCPMYKLTPEYLVSHDSEAFKLFSNLHEAFPEPYVPVRLSSLSNQAATVNQMEVDSSDSFRDGQQTQQQPHQQQKQHQEQSSDTARLYKQAVSSITSTTSAAVESLHSTFDYVPPELITLFVSNIGGNSPSYVYQLLNELYYKSDYLD